jgi:ABC-type polysaccharide/polyol phosphate export permease
MNPMAFIVHFTKEALTSNHFPEVWQGSLFVVIVFGVWGLSMLSYRKCAPHIAENI